MPASLLNGVGATSELLYSMYLKEPSGKRGVFVRSIHYKMVSSMSFFHVSFFNSPP